MVTRSRSVIAAIFLLIHVPLLNAQEKDSSQGPPPAQVVVVEAVSGMVAPQNEFIGTVYYQEVSDVASEVSGKVEKIHFEEGQGVTKGQILAELSSDLLGKSLQAAVAAYEEALSDLKKAEKDFQRATSLYQQELISEQTYDDRQFDAEGMEKKAASLQAEVERLQTELDKKAIRAPFKGVVLKKHTDRGEWLSAGSLVATIAREDSMDIIAEISESVMKYVAPGMKVTVSAGGESMTGTVVAIIPRGTISTRTFPVKIRVPNRFSLIEGMEARVTLPTGKKEKTVMVPRDAVITKFGNTVVFTVNDTKTAMIPVRVIGYNGTTAGIQGPGIEQGTKVVIKGNERLREGQSVTIQKEQ